MEKQNKYLRTGRNAGLSHLQSFYVSGRKCYLAAHVKQLPGVFGHPGSQAFIQTFRINISANEYFGSVLIGLSAARVQMVLELLFTVTNH